MLKKWLTGVSSRAPAVGIEIQSDGIAIAACAPGTLHVTSNDDGIQVRGPLVQSLQLLDKDSFGEEISQALGDWVTSNELKHAPCNLVLQNSEYQLLLVEAPDVDYKELRQALRWRIKDLISIPADKAALDVFLLPKDGSRSGKQMAYVVVTELEKINGIIELINGAGLELAAIDICELALRNLVCLKELGKKESRGVALVRLTEGRGVVSLYRNGNLYLSRQFNIQYGAGLLDDIPVESFLLEVQRSLDYYERQMGQVPPAALYVCGHNISEDKISLDLSRGLSVPVKFLDLETLLQFPEAQSQPLDSGLLHAGVAALGAAIRSDVATSFTQMEAE
ncbi:MSHA biogenesis protein MshI [Alteromonadaceae bacterium 2753L.S.0a.02]|nr:MSHA biogenesis protein MshI [Alteromonadaceae bacterium 2753L.S.0a.02]